MALTIAAIIIVAAFLLSMRYQSSGRKRSPVKQLTHFRGNDVHVKQWRDVWSELPIEETCKPVSAFGNTQCQYSLSLTEK